MTEPSPPPKPSPATPADETETARAAALCGLPPEQFDGLDTGDTAKTDEEASD